MAYNQALNTYQKTSIETVDTLKLVIMCYDRTIRDLQEAKEFHSNRNMDDTYARIRHAQDIVTELLVGLDYERGGEISINLSRLYNFILRQLIGINSRQDVAVYDPLIKILSELRDAWVQIRQEAKPSDVAGAVPTSQNWGVSA